MEIHTGMFFFQFLVEILVDYRVLSWHISDCRSDGKPSIKTYTNPDYFVQLWLESIEKNVAEDKKKHGDRKIKKVCTDYRSIAFPYMLQLSSPVSYPGPLHCPLTSHPIVSTFLYSLSVWSYDIIDVY